MRVARGVAAVLGLVVIGLGVFLGVRTNVAYSAADQVYYDCGMALSSTQQEISEQSAARVAQLYGDPYVPGAIIRACEGERRVWLPWTLIGVGVVLVVGAAVVKRPAVQSSSRT